MGDMAARELKDPLSTQGMLERLLADGTFATDEGSLPPCPGTIDLHCTGQRIARARIKRDAIRVRRLPGGLRMGRVYRVG